MARVAEGQGKRGWYYSLNEGLQWLVSEGVVLVVLEGGKVVGNFRYKGRGMGGQEGSARGNAGGRREREVLGRMDSSFAKMEPTTRRQDSDKDKQRFATTGVDIINMAIVIVVDARSFKADWNQQMDYELVIKQLLLN